MTRSDPTSYTKDSVRSADGTTIGYRQFGQGPGVILVHGGMQASQDFVKLATELSDQFTIFVPDRRGRGMSGPFGDSYSVIRECEDVGALAEKSGAERIFGLSSGAIIALRASLTVPGLRQVALYEPPLSVNGSTPVWWLPRYDREIAQGKTTQALITVFKGIPVGPRFFLRSPRFILAPVLALLIRFVDRPEGDDVSLEALVPTQHYDMIVVQDTADTMTDYRQVAADVLLLGGTKSPPFLKTSLDALELELPNVRRMTLEGLDHLSAANDGKPEVVAGDLERFFTQPR
ncbi:MAG: alpha/beta hydrolase [Candidatus Dormibacteria bacterium]|jgi:pimeloyl-ACP methyl ester carboxylesterase